jgi:hypothetical protein
MVFDGLGFILPIFAHGDLWEKNMVQPRPLVGYLFPFYIFPS